MPYCSFYNSREKPPTRKVIVFKNKKRVKENSSTLSYTKKIAYELSLLTHVGYTLCKK
tara:strand:+ start:359 stop:532 length:174 start_codon:yes stop_codon:yes gene_type:complete